MGHSLNGPSSFARRMKCPASMQMEMGEKGKESVYAKEGTYAHEIAEICLRENKEPESFSGKKVGEFKHENGDITEFIADGDMLESVSIYVDHCRSLMNDNSIIEKKLDIPILGKDGDRHVRGTCDFMSLKDRTLHTVDYKHGKGVSVSPFENIQGLSYGIGASSLYNIDDWDKLRITIIQPRSQGKAIKSWDIEKEDLLYWKMDMASATLETQKDDAEISPSKECKFCSVLYKCKGYVELIKDVLGMDILDEKSKPMELNKLNDEQLSDIFLNKLPLIKNWLSKVEDYAQERAESDKPLPNTKLVRSKQIRKWKDPKEAEEFFTSLKGDLVYEKKFKTAPQMEKLLGKKNFVEYEDMVHKTSTGFTVVSIDDERPSVKEEASKEFGDVSNLID